jgi:hypothetical protein
LRRILELTQPQIDHVLVTVRIKSIDFEGESEVSFVLL